MLEKMINKITNEKKKQIDKSCLNDNIEMASASIEKDNVPVVNEGTGTLSSRQMPQIVKDLRGSNSLNLERCSLSISQSTNPSK